MSLISESLRKAQKQKSNKANAGSKNRHSDNILSESIIKSIISKKSSPIKPRWIVHTFFSLLVIIFMIFLVSKTFLYKKTSTPKQEKGYKNFLQTKANSLSHRALLIDIANIQSLNSRSIESELKTIYPLNKDKILHLDTDERETFIPEKVNTKGNKNLSGLLGENQNSILDPPGTYYPKNQNPDTSLPIEGEPNLGPDMIVNDKRLDPALTISSLTTKELKKELSIQTKDPLPTTQSPQPFFKWEVIKKNETKSIKHNILSKGSFTAKDYNNMGVACYFEGDFKGAIEKLKAAIQLKPDNFESYVNLGIVYKNLNNFDYAFVAYKKAMSLRPDSPDPYYNLGILFDEMGLPKNAVESYYRFLELAPEKYLHLKKKVIERIKKIKI